MIPVAVGIALQLAQFAPALMRYFGVGESNVQVAEKVIGIAKSVTGTETPEEALAAIKANAEFQYKLQEKVLDMQQELDRLYYSDVADARKRDAAFLAAGKVNTRANWLVAIIISMVMALITVVVWKSDLPEYAKGIITFGLGRLWGYLDQVMNFEFGTTRSSQKQQDTIKALAEK